MPVSKARVIGLHWSDVCAPWRIGIPLHALRQLHYDTAEGSMLELPDLADADVVVLHRPMTELHLRCIEALQQRGTRVIVDIDDLFMLDALPESGFGRSWHPLFERWQAEARAAAGAGSVESARNAPPNRRIEYLQRCLRAADAVTVTTQPLVDAYSAFSTRIHVLMNCFDDANPLWSLPAPRSAACLPVNVGFAGSDFQTDNLRLLRGALEPVLGKHPDVSVVEAGGPALLPLIDAAPEQLIHLGTVPFAGFPLVLRQMDVVLAPLADTPFMRCKSNIRCFTAGLAHAPVIATPVGSYAAYVEHGLNGLLARSADEWTVAIERLVVDVPFRRQLAEANYRRAQSYAISCNIWRWAEVYESVLSSNRSA